MYKILGTIDWMDDDTRKAALDKAKSMTNHIAYPAELLDSEKLGNTAGVTRFVSTKHDLLSLPIPRDLG